MDMEVSTSDFNNTPRGNVSLDVQSVSEETRRVVLQNRPLMGGCLGVVLNVLTLVAVGKHKDLTPFLRCLLVSLVIQNMGKLALMFTAGVNLHPSYAERMTVIYLSFVCVNSAALTLLVIAVDRVTAVYFPLFYKATEKWPAKIVLSVLGPWVLGVFFTYMAITRGLSNLPYGLAHMTDSGLLLQGTLFLFCGAGIFFAYIAVGVRLRLCKRRVVVHPSFLSATATARVITPAEGQRSRRLTVHIAFLAVWSCFISITGAGYVFFLYVNKVDMVAETNTERLVFMLYIVFVNSIISPFLICWRLVSYRSVVDVLRSLVSRLCPPGPASQPGTQPPWSQNRVDVEAVTAATGRIVEEASHLQAMSRGQSQSGSRSWDSSSTRGSNDVQSRAEKNAVGNVNVLTVLSDTRENVVKPSHLEVMDKGQSYCGSTSSDTVCIAAIGRIVVTPSHLEVEDRGQSYFRSRSSDTEFYFSHRKDRCGTESS